MPLPCAWRLPGLVTVLAGAVLLHRPLVVESGGSTTREVGWVQSAALMVRREAARDIGYLDPDFFVYSDETDFCKRLHDAGGLILHVPGAEVIHHEQLASDVGSQRRRVVEFHRGRDRYLRKHHGSLVALLARPLLAWPYLPRAIAALVLPQHDPRLYFLHARQALRPGSGEGMREAAEAFNAARAART
jgi:GT2 family glycosyltransferase